MSRIPRLLVVLLAAVLALAALSAGASLAHAAAAKPRKPDTPSCQAGQVVVRVAAKAPAKARKGRRAKPAAKLVCRSVVPKGGATLTDAQALALARPSIAELRAGLPKRVAKRFPAARITKLEAAMRRALATAGAARTTARASAAADCAGPGTVRGPEEDVKDGVKVVGYGQRWGELQSPTHGSGTDVTVTLPDGSSQRKQNSECTSWDLCPDADGKLAGRYVWSSSETLRAAKDGVSVTITVKMRIEADLTAHVGADGRLTTFDWVAEGTGSLRGEIRQGAKVLKHIAVGTVRTVTRGTGADPRETGRMPSSPDVRAWGSLGGVLDGDSQPTIDVVRGLVAMSRGVPADASFELLMAEKVFYDQAKCLDVVFDPEGAQIAPNQQLQVAVKVKAKDGAEVAATYDATAVVGSVAPASATTPGPTTWTAPAELHRDSQPTFSVVAVSKRGRAVGTHHGVYPERSYWQVTFEGSGTYHRYEPRGIPYPQLWSDHEFSWKTTYEPVRLPPEGVPVGQPGRWGATSVSVTGTLNGKRVDGGGTRTCSAAPDPDPKRQVAWIEVRQRGDEFLVSPTAFAFLVPPWDTACSTFEDMLLWTQGTADAMTADVVVGWAQRGNEDELTYAVKPSRALQPCDGGESNGDFTCTHTVEWQGTIHMKKVAAPPGAQG